MSEIPPQQYADYPRLSIAPRIRFEAISEAWKFVQAELGTWILATFLFFVITFAFITPIYILALGSVMGNPHPQIDAILRMYAIMIPGMFIGYIGQAIGLGGMFNLAMKQVQGYPITIRDFFSTGGSVWSHVGAGLIFVFAVMVGSIACYIPGFIVGGLLMFIHPIIVHQRVGAPEAIRLSWSMLKPHIWTALGFYLLVSLVAGLGALLCGIGLLASYPIYALAISIVYRDFVQALHAGQTLIVEGS
jgi:hypothetical protein